MTSKEIHHKIVEMDKQGLGTFAHARVGGITRGGRIYDGRFWFHSSSGAQAIEVESVKVVKTYE